MNGEATVQIQQPPGGSNKRGVLLLLFVIAVVIAVLCAVMRPREPSWHGKRLTTWLSELKNGDASFYDQKDPKVIEGREAVRRIGTNAIPTLLRMLRAKDSALKTAIINLIEMQDHVRIPIRTVEEQKELAGIGFYCLGDIATNAVPALIDIFQRPPEPYSRNVAERVLMELYPAKSVAVPYWLPAESRAGWYLEVGMVQSANEAGTSSNALLAFSEAIRLEPTNVDARLSRGNARMMQQDLRGALDDFDKVIEISPTNNSALYAQGVCKLALKDFKAAELAFTSAINMESNHFNAYNYRGVARANLRDFKGALQDFRKAIELSPEDATFYRSRASVEAMQTDYEVAMEDVAKSLALESKDAAAYALRARIQSALKNYQAAVTDATTAIKLAPRDPGGYTARAIVRVSMDEFPACAADLETALQLNPTNANVFLIRAVFGAKRGGDDDAALADFERAVELAPYAPETHGMLGLFQYKISRREDALANCRKALEIGASVNTASYRACIWLIRAQSGEEDAATQELNSYLKSLEVSKTNEWSALTAQFLTGALPETDFLTLATTAAKRPSAVTSQVCESLYYAAMKRKLAGDKPGALDLLQKCLATRYDNSMEYLYARDELRALKSLP